MENAVERLVGLWLDAGVIDADAAARIRAFEDQRGRAPRLRWPVWIALGFGALAVGAGVLLFVAAHWDQLSPAARLALVLAGIGVFQLSGSAVAERFPAMATAMHGLGTVAYGAGIFLAGQVFNLAEHWPSGLLLWAVGAGVGWGLLRTWPQLALLALLTPAWLVSEWSLAAQGSLITAAHVGAAGVALLALAYFAAGTPSEPSLIRRVLHIIGAAAFLPSALALALASSGRGFVSPDTSASPVSTFVIATGWITAIGGPVLTAALAHRRVAWTVAIAAAWVLVLLGFPLSTSALWRFAWWALSAVAIVAWSARTGRVTAINLGAVVFGATVLTFYSSQVMTAMGRSASLIGLGLIFLAGGWLLERTRRQLIRRIQGGRS
jgi:hypothetical protein